MRLTRRLVFYLILNILVSALTTLGVLLWWDANHRSPLTTGAPPMVTGQPGTQPAPLSPGGAQPTLPPLDKAVIEIKNVFGVGDLKNEVVVIQRVGDGELFISGWLLEDEDGNRYSFPDLLLNAGGAVQVYSRAGTDTVNELYWGAQKPIWRSGEVITLLDTEGNARASYSIP